MDLSPTLIERLKEFFQTEDPIALCNQKISAYDIREFCKDLAEAAERR